MEAMAAAGTHSTQLLAIERNAGGSVAAIHLAVTLRPGDDTTHERGLLEDLIFILEGDGDRYLQGRLGSLIVELADQDEGRRRP